MILSKIRSASTMRLSEYNFSAKLIWPVVSSGTATGLFWAQFCHKLRHFGQYQGFVKAGLCLLQTVFPQLSHLAGKRTVLPQTKHVGYACFCGFMNDLIPRLSSIPNSMFLSSNRDSCYKSRGCGLSCGIIQTQGQISSKIGLRPIWKHRETQGGLKPFSP